MLKQNTEILRKEIYDLHHVVGISFSEITRQSRVHNLQKIISGDIDPTIKSWYRLHRAFPEHISKPSYTDGSYIYENTASGTGSVANSGTIKNAATGGMSLTPHEQTLISALRELGEIEDKVIRKILASIDEISEKLRD